MRERGFTLIELMIVIAIIGILASIAVPQYRQYMRQAIFTEVRSAAAPIKTQIESCYALNGGTAQAAACNEVAVGAPVVRGQVTTTTVARAANGSAVQSVELVSSTAPTIRVTPSVDRGVLASDTYLLTGMLNADGSAIDEWRESGAACNKGYC